jgi:hypothetical protein
MDTISQAVGLRNGVTPLPNKASDVLVITALLDRIPLIKGGTAATPRLWSPTQPVLIPQVAAAIFAFQTANRMAKCDSAVDPGGSTLKLMNQLAGPAPVAATVVSGDENSQLWVVADPSSMPGVEAIRTRDISPTLTRKLVRVTGTSIKWFGVVLPKNAAGTLSGGSPHVFFTPAPWQGGYQDGTYDQFAAWNGLWDKYTSIMGSQLAASGAPQILVIPFYTNAQSGKLGDFLNNWKEVLSAVLTAAINSVDPLFLRDTYQFQNIYSSSFSNGITSLQNFHTKGAGAADMTRMVYDMDGQASGSQWRPGNGVIYLNTRAPNSVNPSGQKWYVGGRFAQMRPRYAGTIDHNLCPFLLLHGLSNFGR